MRHLILTISLSSICLFGQGNPAAETGLEDYQKLALQHLWKQPAVKSFDLKPVPMEKILSSAVVLDRKCVIPLLQGKADKKVDPHIRKAAPPATDRMPRFRSLPTCASDG